MVLLGVVLRILFLKDSNRACARLTLDGSSPKPYKARQALHAHARARRTPLAQVVAITLRDKEAARGESHDLVTANHVLWHAPSRFTFCVLSCMQNLGCACIRMEVSGCDVLLGVVSSLTDAGRLLRAAVRQSYAHEAARVCVRFLVGNASLLPPGRRRFVAPALDESRASGNDLVWLHADDRNCASKTFAWFTFAARHAPASTKWIAKADDDTFVQTDALAADLAALQDDANPPRVMAGHINWASTWAPVSPGSLAGKPCGPVAHFRGLWRPRDGRTLPDCGTSTRSYPFAAGPLYALSTTLVRLVFRESWAVAAMARTQRWVCSGEDAMLGYCVSLAGALANFTVTLAHMTWVRRRRRRRCRRHEPSLRCHAHGALLPPHHAQTKMHNFHPTLVSYDTGPPGDESVAVHRLKCPWTPKSVWALLAASMRGRRRAQPLFRYVWAPFNQTAAATTAAGTLESHSAAEHAAWRASQKRCDASVHYCRPPLRRAAWTSAACAESRTEHVPGARLRSCGASYMPRVCPNGSLST